MLVILFFIAFYVICISAVPLKESGTRQVAREIHQVNFSTNYEGKIQLVVSHHTENMDSLGWIHVYPHIVYDRAVKLNAAFNSTWQENIGREGYVYLKHIVDHYHQLADLTIFLQADASNNPWQVHSSSFKFNVQGLATGNISLPELSDGFAFLGAEGNCMSRVKPFTAHMPKGYEGEFRKQLNFIVPNPRYLPQGLFAVTREAIHRNPVPYYTALLRKIGKESNSAYELFLERAWPEVFHSICGAHVTFYFCFPGAPQDC